MDLEGKCTMLRPTFAFVMMAVVSTLVAPPAAAERPTDGYLYGTVTTKGGTEYTGLLRWGDEETFWDDLFHSAKEELPYREFAESAEEGRQDERWWEVFGRKLNIRLGMTLESRVFIARFGDIQSIEVTGKGSAKVTMKSGSVYEVSGYANDVSAVITVRDPALGDVELEWQRIDTIVFKATPANVEPSGARLFGTVVTESGTFEGFVQWDRQECLSVDRLDGKAEDGSMSVPMGSIRTIERRSKTSSRVTLVDGRELVLSGTNDVNDDNRGVLVEDPRYGRVEVPWSAFERVDLREPPSSGRGYDDYPPGVALEGRVTRHDGTQLSGRLVLDLDESESWEMLNGTAFDISYNIPLERVAAIEPHGDSAKVTLRGGEELRLEDQGDVSDRNAGVVVVSPAGDPTFVRWSDLKQIDLAS